MHSDEARDQRIQNAFGRGHAVRIEDACIRHEMPDVAHKQQTAPRHGGFTPIGELIDTIRLELSRGRAARRMDRRFERPFHQAQPVAVASHLVVRIDRRRRILEIDDRRQRGLDMDIGKSGWMSGAHGITTIEAQLDAETVVLQQNGTRIEGITSIAEKLRTIGEVGARLLRAYVEKQCADLDRAGQHLAMRTRALEVLDRQEHVEPLPHLLYDLGASNRVVRRTARSTPFF